MINPVLVVGGIFALLSTFFVEVGSFEGFSDIGRGLCRECSRYSREVGSCHSRGLDGFSAARKFEARHFRV